MHPDPDLIVILSMGLVGLIGFPIARAIARRISGDAQGPAPTALPPDMAARLERLEHIAEATQIEVERMAEGQRFTTKLLSERVGALAQPGSTPRQ